MKKLLIFSILFSIFNISVMNVKADNLFYDEPLVIEKDIFDAETYNLSDCTMRNGLGYYKFKSLYPDNYNSLVEFFEENGYYYVFGADALLFWQEEGLEYLVFAQNSSSSGQVVTSGLYNPNHVYVKVAYYNASIKGSTILNNYFTNTNDKIITSYGGIMYQNTGSNSISYGYQLSKPTSSYGIVLDTNIDIRFDSDYRATFSVPTGYKFYHSIIVNGKTYNSGDYINKKYVQPNPKITFDFLTDTGEEGGHKVGVTTTIDFQTGGVKNNRYSYAISFNHGETWDDLTPRITSDTYTFVKLENFSVVARLYDSETGESYYSTGLIDNIETGYYSKWLTVQRGDNDVMIKDDNGDEFLFSSVINIFTTYNINNGYPLRLYYSLNGETWRMLHNEDKPYYSLELRENRTVYFMYKDLSNQDVFYSTFQVNWFDQKGTLGTNIIFSEKCTEKKDSCQAIAHFMNYGDNDRFFVTPKGGQYKEINMSDFFDVYYFGYANLRTKYCAKITDKNGNSKVEKCYMLSGIKETASMNSLVNTVKSFIDDQKEKINKVSYLIQDMYDTLPVSIQQFMIFSYFLTCMIAIIWNVRK